MLSLLRLERKQKDFSKPFRIRIFFFLSYSFGIETIKTLIQSLCFLKNHTRFQFRPKRHKNPTWWGGTYLYSSPPPQPGVGRALDRTPHWNISNKCPTSQLRVKERNSLCLSRLKIVLVAQISLVFQVYWEINFVIRSKPSPRMTETRVKPTQITCIRLIES